MISQENEKQIPNFHNLFNQISNMTKLKSQRLLDYQIEIDYVLYYNLLTK